MRTRVLVLGGDFAGLTAAFAVHHELGGDADVTVISKDDRFVFTPSLIWLPFGEGERAEITVPIAPMLHEHGISFVNDTVTRLDPVARAVFLKDGRMLHYDYAVIATGYRTEDGVVPPFLGQEFFPAEMMAHLAASSIAAQAHLMKLGSEKYHPGKMRHGYVTLP